MKCFSTLIVAAAGLLAAPETTTVRADDPAEKGAALADASLREMLVRLGYAPAEIKSPVGISMYKIVVERDDWRVIIYASLSGSKARLWLASPVADLPETGKVSAAALERLLALNDDLGPTHFGLRGRRVFLNTPMDNVGITEKRLRTEIDNLAANVKRTSEYWKDLRADKHTAVKK